MLDFRDSILVSVNVISEANKMTHFLAHFLWLQATPKDIEELVEVGKSMKLCPYFGSRHAIPLAEVSVHFSHPVRSSQDPFAAGCSSV